MNVSSLRGYRMNFHVLVRLEGGHDGLVPKLFGGSR